MVGFGESISSLIHQDNVWISRAIAVAVLLLLLGNCWMHLSVVLVLYYHKWLFIIQYEAKAGCVLTSDYGIFRSTPLESCVRPQKVFPI